MTFLPLTACSRQKLRLRRTASTGTQRWIRSVLPSFLPIINYSYYYTYYFTTTTFHNVITTTTCATPPLPTHTHITTTLITTYYYLIPCPPTPTQTLCMHMLTEIARLREEFLSTKAWRLRYAYDISAPYIRINTQGRAESR